MRIISIAAAAAFFAAQAFAAAAAPTAPLTQGVQSESTFQLIKEKKKSMTAEKGTMGKKHMHSKHMHMKHMSHRKGMGPGRCGTGKYFKGGKCMSAADKKPAK